MVEKNPCVGQIIYDPEQVAPEITESCTSNSGSPGKTSDGSEKEVVSGSLKRMA